jgi:hypothetical protein
VFIRSGIVRRVVIVVAVLLVSGVAAAMKLTSWTPANMCFCPTPDHPDSAAKSESDIETLGTAGSFRVPSDTSGVSHSASSALGGAAGLADHGGKSHGKAHEGGKRSGPPAWGHRGNRGNRRWSSDASGSGPSASLGSLWKMMSLSGRAQTEESVAPGARVAAPARTARTSPPPAPKAPAAAPTPPSGAISATPEDTTALLLPPAASAFGEDTTPVSELVDPSSGGSTPTGSLGSGSSASAAADAAGNMASNPEPASFALIATGLLGIAGLVRRRRV